MHPLDFKVTDWQRGVSDEGYEKGRKRKVLKVWEIEIGASSF